MVPACTCCSGPVCDRRTCTDFINNSLVLLHAALSCLWMKDVFSLVVVQWLFYPLNVSLQYALSETHLYYIDTAAIVAYDLTAKTSLRVDANLYVTKLCLADGTTVLSCLFYHRVVTWRCQCQFIQRSCCEHCRSVSCLSVVLFSFSLSRSLSLSFSTPVC